MDGLILLVCVLVVFTLSFLLTNFALKRLISQASIAYDVEVMERPISLPAHVNDTDKEMEYRKNHKDKHLSELSLTYRFFQIIACVLLTIILTYMISFHSVPIVKDITVWGALGDYFGGILNPILGFASFIALLYTIRLQSKELAMTREELARSADASEKSGIALNAQLYTLKRQAFEATLFKFQETVDQKLYELTHKTYNILYIEFDSLSRLPEKRRDFRTFAKKVNYELFVDFVAASKLVGKSPLIMDMTDLKIREAFDHKISIGQEFILLPRGLTESLQFFNQIELDSIILFLSVFEYLDSSEIYPEAWPTYLAMLKSRLDDRLAFCILLTALYEHTMYLKKVINKYGLLEQLDINADTGEINNGLYGVKDFDFEHTAYGNNLAYREYIAEPSKPV